MVYVFVKGTRHACHSLLVWASISVSAFIHKLIRLGFDPSAETVEVVNVSAKSMLTPCSVE
jgi:hypothetical protein